MQERPLTSPDDRRAVADRAHAHRAEQDSRPRLPARRDDGPALVRRRGLPAADGRTADAGDRPHARSRARVVGRSRRHAALDAGRAQCRDLGRPAQGLRRGGHSGVRSAPRRRHRIVHAVSRRRPRPRPRPAGRLQQAAETIVEECVRDSRCRPASAIASTRAIRAPRGCFRWRSSSSSKASTSG